MSQDHVQACIDLLNEQNVIITKTLNDLVAAQAVISRVSSYLQNVVAPAAVVTNTAPHIDGNLVSSTGSIKPGVYGANGRIGEINNAAIEIKPTPTPPAPVVTLTSGEGLRSVINDVDRVTPVSEQTFPGLNLPGIIEHPMPSVAEQHATPALTHDAEEFPVQIMQDGIISDTKMKIVSEAPRTEEQADAFLITELMKKLTGTNTILCKYLSADVIRYGRGWLGLQKPFFVSDIGRTNAEPAELGRLSIVEDQYREAIQGLYVTRDHVTGYAVCELKLDVVYNDIAHVVHFDWNNKEHTVNVTITLTAGNDIYGENTPYQLISGAPQFALMIPPKATMLELAGFIKAIETKLNEMAMANYSATVEA